MKGRSDMKACPHNLPPNQLINLNKLSTTTSILEQMLLMITLENEEKKDNSPSAACKKDKIRPKRVVFFYNY